MLDACSEGFSAELRKLFGIINCLIAFNLLQTRQQLLSNDFFPLFCLKDFTVLCTNMIQPLNRLIVNMEVGMIQEACPSGGIRFLTQRIMRENSGLIYAKLQPPSAFLFQT